MKSDKGSRAALLEAAVHEAGHAVAHWYLDRTRYRDPWGAMPVLHHVAISLSGEPLFSARGQSLEAGGVCAAEPCVNPDFPVFSWHSRDLRRRCYLGAMADIICTMAGPIAQAIREEKPIRNAWEWRDSPRVGAGVQASDYEQVDARCKMMGRLSGRRWRLCFERAFERADWIVRNHKLHIRELTGILIARGTVDGAEVYQLFEKLALDAHCRG